MSSNKLPNVGDIIRSTQFVYGERSFDKTNKRICVGRDEPQYIIREHLTEDEIEVIALKTGKMPKGDAQWVDRDYGSADLTRAKAEYVVIEARMQGGGSSGWPNDGDYPDGWHVVAKRLKKGRVWDPKGEEIEFYMTGCFINMISSKRVKIVGKMGVSYT